VVVIEFMHLDDNDDDDDGASLRITLPCRDINADNYSCDNKIRDK
jgi:hypothetical protein